MMTLEQKSLVEDNIKFAYWLVNKWTSKQGELDLDELESVALEALTIAATKFDASRGMSFANFAKMKINHNIIGEINKQKNYNKSCSSKSIEEGYQPGEATDLSIDVHMAISKLPKHYQEMLIDYYFNGLDQSEIGIKNNISISSVSLILKQCRENMKEFLKP